MTIADFGVYAGLFFASIAAATIFPFQSEFALAALLLTQDYHPLTLLIVASVGNTLGSVANWVLGRLMARLESRRWFPIKRHDIARAERWYHRYGKWSLLLSWAPFIGDPLTVVAGVLREPLPVFILLVAFAKTARYVAVIAMTDASM